MAIWKIEQITETEGALSVVHWRVYDDVMVQSIYGTVSVEGLTLGPKTTEAEVIERVKAALNAHVEQRDEHGNVVPPLPGAETAKTDALEAAIAKMVEDAAHPKTKTVQLPWVA